jgi:hypothetical protein
MNTLTLTPKIRIDAGILEELRPQAEEQRIVTVHCRYDNKIGIRTHIWSTTYLIDHDSGSKCKLLHAENIIFAPQWQPILEGTTLRFTLFFQSLPKTCTSFSIVEECPENGGFYATNISRNANDVYKIMIELRISFWH